MKRNLIGLFAIVAGLGLSAFTTKAKPNANLYYWFEQTNHTYVGSSSSPSINPLGCQTVGNNCVKGYLRSSQPASEPTGNPDASAANP